MAYPEVRADGTIRLSHDMIDMLVAVIELTEAHKSMSDSDIAKAAYLKMIVSLNAKINDDMHKLGLEDLFEVRNRLELSVRSVIRARRQAYSSLHNVIEAKI